MKIDLKADKYKYIMLFILSVSVIFIIGLLNKPSVKKYYYDSELYYHLSTTFFKNGHFSFLNFELSIRGYLFPFILFCYNIIGHLFYINPSISILLGNSLFASFIFIFILPDLFSIKKYTNCIRILLPIIFILLYWSDLIYYPLSDLYSYGMLIISIWLIKKIDFSHIIKSVFYGILIGILLYAAYNTRTIYLFVIPVILIIFIILQRKENLKKLLTIIFSICLGIVICAIPQININNNYYHKNTMSVITNSLFEFQLYAGLSTQKYETYVGDVKDYPQAGLGFIDGTGNQLLQKEKLILNKNFTIASYIKLALKYPLDYMGIIARHFINVFHLQYRHAYIIKLHNYNGFFTVLNYTILFIAGLGFLVFLRKKENALKHNINRLYLMVTLIPCIMILPGSIETRFFIPMYFMIYYFIAYKLPFKETIKFINKYKLNVIISYIFILAIFTAVWGATCNSAQAVPQLLG